MTPDATAPAPTRRIVVLAGPGDATAIVYHYLAERFDDVVAVIEEPASRATLARRRARRLGWGTVAGQVAFVTLAMPVLRRRARGRIREILAGAALDARPVTGAHAVSSVNAAGTVALLATLTPAVVVVQGTRIIAPVVLQSLGCPVVNTHAGITPRYRGVHGGYWALAEGRPDLVGTTVHLVDAGIDTGTVLARAYFTPGPDDSIATYPYLHLACGLPALAAELARLLGDAGDAPTPASGPDDADAPGESRLRWHPTLWGYLARRWRSGVR